MTSIQIKKKLKSKIEKLEGDHKLLKITKAVDEILEKKTLKWDSLSEVERNSILKGLEELERGESIDYEDLKKDINKWLRR